MDELCKLTRKLERLGQATPLQFEDDTAAQETLGLAMAATGLPSKGTEELQASARLGEELQRELGDASLLEKLLLSQLASVHTHLRRADDVVSVALVAAMSPRNPTGKILLAREFQHIADRASRRFLRTLTALQQLRSAPIKVSINVANAVNVAQNQVNVAAEKPGLPDNQAPADPA
ncbi:MAG: hypothetical protein AB1566_03185 [Chloroflexota bacterium]